MGLPQSNDGIYNNVYHSDWLHKNCDVILSIFITLCKQYLATSCALTLNCTFTTASHAAQSECACTNDTWQSSQHKITHSTAKLGP